jgi:hypothetical protein
MNCIKYFLRYFYYEESRSSKCQLEKDFGCYPPSPISAKEFGSEFVVVKIRGLGCIYPYILNAKRLWRTKDISEVPEAYHECWKQLLSVKDELAEVRNKLTSITNTIVGKVLLVIILIIVTPIMVPMIFWKFLIFVIKNYHHMDQKLKGYFIPLFTDENRVMVNNGRSKNMDVEVVVTHEHIHMLQHMNKEVSCNNSKCAEILLADEWRNDKLLLYILEKNELEARLHEIVISYYRNNNRLPVTTEGFIELLASSTQFGLVITKSMGLKTSTDAQSVIKCYEERSKQIAMEIELILFCIKDNNLRRQFINEVLTVMYGKLIKYYGDENLSSNLLKSISRPNLYDRIYIHQHCDLIVH